MYDLHRLGWNSFQQLCLTIAREVLGQTVQSFLDSNDAGRDGAFTGSWTPASGQHFSGNFVIQCKFSSKAGYLLTKSDITDEIPKVRRLVASRLCDVYVLMTNAGVSGRQEAQIRSELLGAGAALAGAAPGFVVAGQAGRRRFGLFVETICHTEEIVVKPMGARLRGIPYFSGHTILGDGTVVLILDPGGLARALGSVAGEESPDPRLVEGSTEAPETPTAMLVFRAGGPGPKAVPLALVSRLEEVDSASIEWAAGRALLQIFPIRINLLRDTFLARTLRRFNGRQHPRPNKINKHQSDQRRKSIL